MTSLMRSCGRLMLPIKRLAEAPSDATREALRKLSDWLA
jgi:hypothetical protein